jgi:hypothetical protein
MKKQLLLLLMVLALGLVFAITNAADQEVPKILTMNSKVYKGAGLQKMIHLPFSHQKHSDKTEQKGYNIACSECHHRYEEGKNLWKEGDKVEKCEVCHKEPGPTKEEKKAARKDKEKQRELIKKYHYSAVHSNCLKCHKDMKKSGAEKFGPVGCTKGCHNKNSKSKNKGN